MLFHTTFVVLAMILNFSIIFSDFTFGRDAVLGSIFRFNSEVDTTSQIFITSPEDKINLRRSFDKIPYNGRGKLLLSVYRSIKYLPEGLRDGPAVDMLSNKAAFTIACEIIMIFFLLSLFNSHLMAWKIYNS